MIDSGNKSKDGFVVMINSATESYKKDKDSSIVGKRVWFKQRSRSMAQNKRYNMDGWAKALLKNMHG